MPDARHYVQGEEEKTWPILKGPPSNCDFEFFSKYEESSEWRMSTTHFFPKPENEEITVTD